MADRGYNWYGEAVVGKPPKPYNALHGRTSAGVGVSVLAVKRFSMPWAM